MPRRSSFLSVMNAVARDVGRAQRQAEAERRRVERESIQAIRVHERELQRSSAAAEKEARQRYLEDRIAETEELNRQMEERLSDLSALVEDTLRKNDAIDFETLRIREPFPGFSPPADVAAGPPDPEKEDYLASVKPPGFLGRLLPGAADEYREACAIAEEEFNRAIEQHRSSEERRKAKLETLRKQHEVESEAHKKRVQDRDAEVEQLRTSYLARDPAAVVAYNDMVLERSCYPEGFPQEFRVAYVPESRQLVVDYELPGPDIVPPIGEYRYVKTKDLVEERPRKPADAKPIYEDVVASVALRTCHEVLEADQADAIDAVVFSGFVQAVDPATGKDKRPYLISVRTTKERFSDIDLSRVDKRVCLRNLGAQVSPRPDEVQAVKPIVTFDMVDKRFVEQSDVLADLDARPNLMDLNPFEFEHLIANLFKQIGLETRLTRSSRDGGVDVVAFDTRPVLGGKVVIQAKRYKNTVGVAAVRDLYGTMINEGANKGILVTTSGYGPDAFEFAKDKPIELMDGGQLLYMLDQVGVKARIIFPEEGGAGA